MIKRLWNVSYTYLLWGLVSGTVCNHKCETLFPLSRSVLSYVETEVLGTTQCYKMFEVADWLVFTEVSGVDNM
jgi:hypothetical protein